MVIEFNWYLFIYLFILKGGLDNIEIAKSYYSQAIKLNPKNLRALYGLYLVSSDIHSVDDPSIGVLIYFVIVFQCCHHIGNSKMVLAKRKEAQKLSQWALAKVAEVTNENARPKKTKDEVDFVAAVEASFGTLEIK